MNRVIFRPIITEKSMTHAAGGWYTFMVEKMARKETIAQAIASRYAVTVTEIRTRTMHGKVHRAGRKMMQVIRPDWKKATVKLKAGQKIDAFDVTQQTEAPAPVKKETTKK